MPHRARRGGVAVPITRFTALAFTLSMAVAIAQPKPAAQKLNASDCARVTIDPRWIPVKKKSVSLLLSGINRGSNAADDITYSGTVAAAMEGTILNVPSIALSQLVSDREKPHWKSPWRKWTGKKRNWKKSPAGWRSTRPKPWRGLTPPFFFAKPEGRVMG